MLFTTDVFDIHNVRHKGPVARPRKEARAMAHHIRVAHINTARTMALGATHGVVTHVQVTPVNPA